MPELSHRTDSLLQAHQPWWGRRIPKQVKGKRPCNHTGCKTLLSRYNRGSFCFAHDGER